MGCVGDESPGALLGCLLGGEGLLDPRRHVVEGARQGADLVMAALDAAARAQVARRELPEVAVRRRSGRSARLVSSTPMTSASSSATRAAGGEQADLVAEHPLAAAPSTSRAARHRRPAPLATPVRIGKPTTSWSWPPAPGTTSGSLRVPPRARCSPAGLEAGQVVAGGLGDVDEGAVVHDHGNGVT